jgi:hypothetical protein
MMGGVTDDLVTWLRNALDDDERMARRLQDNRPGPWSIDVDYPGEPAGGTAVLDVHRELVAVARGGYVGDYMSERSPDLVLRDIAAKRRIIELCEPPLIDVSSPGECPPRYIEGRGASWGEPVLRLLALPYADRPGYREEWRPS